MLTPEEKKAKQAEYYKKWLSINSEEKKAKQLDAVKKYQAKNMKKLLTYQKKWRENNPEKIASRLANRDKAKYCKRSAQYYIENRESILEKRRLQRMEISGKNKPLEAKEKLLKSVSVYNCFNMVRGL